MRSSIFVFVLCCSLFSCVYAVTKPYKITQVMLHDNMESDIKLLLSDLFKKKVDDTLILELSIAPQVLDSIDFNKVVTTQEASSATTSNTQYKYIVLEDFVIDKPQQIDTPLGLIKLRQDSALNNVYVEFNHTSTIRNAMLFAYNKKVYLVCSSTALSSRDIPLTKDSNVQSILEENNYEVSSWRYFVVLGIMIIILILLYMIKLRQNRGMETSNIILEQAKILDSKNKVALIRYGDKRYLVGINPHGITLLDSIQCDTQTKRSDDVDLNSQHKDTEQQNFMQLFLKRR
ncbi:flagellar biosynthetic protein FliO [Helicobacter trogontum]|uniref:Flagellar protein n=1 Tax=Helicobacter trogontum TaxID=50960 RepID=A0A4V6HYM7_9HELI|nr:flagellar biosynthetic protein FliO [Helicobacter trogontum]TLD81212.1 hypothetical protein LS81_008920 [Helicobacter trogontum]